MNINITDNDKSSLISDLSNTIFNFSFGKLDKLQADNLAKNAVESIDFKNSALMHKGVNWYARKIISMIYFDSIKSNQNK